jgi:alpha-methylacyl-CoA racemase
MSGPLTGYRVVELAGLGPTPFAGMLLSDLGADVVRVDRVDGNGSPLLANAERDVLARGRRSIGVDLKKRQGVDLVLDLAAQADVLIEGFRPGTAERLGIGPQACWLRNKALVYGRMTGWGQEGPLAAQPGHDINYIALAGVLHHMARAGSAPVPPLNLVGDMGGGGLLLAFGVVSALLESQRSGIGQVVDAAMVDGAALLMTAYWGLRAMGQFSGPPGENSTDTGAHFYDVYETKDGRHMAVGAVEPAFYRRLCDLTDLDFDEAAPLAHLDPASWAEGRKHLSGAIRTKTQQEWVAAAADSEACMTPVLSMDEAAEHPHNRARGTFTTVGSVPQPAPAPRFSRTPAAVAGPPVAPGTNTEEILEQWLGMAPSSTADLRDRRVVI